MQPLCAKTRQDSGETPITSRCLLLAGLFAGAALIALASSPAAAGKPPAPSLSSGKAKLECKLVPGPEAKGMVKYEADRGKRSLMAVVEVERPPADDEVASFDDPDSVPLYAAGDLLPVLIGTGGAYKAGDIKLARDGDGLEGALKFELKPQRRRDIRPFPSNFPTLTAGTVVTIDGRSCTLQDRSRGWNKR